MTAGTCTAAVTVMGHGTFTCEDDAGHRPPCHVVPLPTDGKWATVSWTGDTATIRPPGTRGGGA